MRLVFYSGGDEKDNTELDRALLSMVGKPSPTITYIPSCSYDSEVDFYDFVRQYRRYRITRFLHFPVDVPTDDTFVKQAFKSDIIHLSGGNTFYFLKYLRKFGYLRKLKEFVAGGGILTGLSAGAIIMTPNIHMASIPDFDKDDNDEKVKNFRSMNLVPFEFFPHYRNSVRYDKELIRYSRKIKIPIFACPDGAGILVQNQNITFCGKAWCFHNGQKFPVNNNRKKIAA